MIYHTELCCNTATSATSHDEDGPHDSKAYVARRSADQAHISHVGKILQSLTL